MRPAYSSLTTTAVLAAFATYAVGAGADPRGKLATAKTVYEIEVRTFNRAVTAYYDKAEDAARAKGDLKALETTQREFEEFKTSGMLAQAVRKQAFVPPLVQARQKMNTAYSTAVKEYLLAKEDRLAAETEKERKGFVVSTALRLGPTKYLSSIRPARVKSEKDGFELDRIIKLPDAEVPHCIALYPPDKDPAEATFLLSGKWGAFRARVGVPRFRDTVRPPDSKLTYEVLGDGVSLWKSLPNNALNDFQLCEIPLEGVKQLTLKVHCLNGNGWARACWLEPLLAE